MRFKFDWFMKGMVLVVGLAFLWPEPGARGGWLHPELLNKAGVAFVFFLNGLALSFESLKEGARRWQAHLMVQACTYGLFPLLGLAMVHAGRDLLGPELALGFFFLCALPSTVSSSVALTAAARGNVPVAVFNATLSSLIGVLLTPAWLAIAMHRTGSSFPIGPVVADLALWLVLPLVLGQLARPWGARFAQRHKKGLNMVDRATILLLLYTSFCDSVLEGVWTRYRPTVILVALAGSAVLFAIALGAMSWASRATGLGRAERVAVIFCGSKKSLAAGVPMAALIFGHDPALGLLLLPLMIYHPLQLAIGGALAQRWGQAADAGDSDALAAKPAFPPRTARTENP
jgi:sodium/bile acid cotransporter 7